MTEKLPLVTDEKLWKIAKVCHEANKAFCESIDDWSQPSWGKAPDWQKDSAYLGVQFCLNNPDAPASANHESWLKVKIAEGWTFGEVKDPAAKTHPCMVPYTELPHDQQVKDLLFKNIVSALGK